MNLTVSKYQRTIKELEMDKNYMVQGSDLQGGIVWPGLNYLFIVNLFIYHVQMTFFMVQETFSP